MKILVTYATAGAGHRKCAEAIFDLLKKETNHSVSLVDFLDYTLPPFKLIYSKGYALLVTCFPSLWNFLFKLNNNPIVFRIDTPIRQALTNLLARRFINFLSREKFDCCITTQFMVNEIISVSKTSKNIASKLICVVTDYNVHRVWLASGVDFYAVACRETQQRLLSLGVAEKKIKTTGIPIHVKFLTPQDKQQLLRKLGLKPNLLTVLMLTGTFGFGPIKKLVLDLQDRFQLLVVCGNNHSLFNELNRIKNEHTYAYELVDNIDELMSAADLVITKPGGQTISEALVKHLPMLFISAIPGQETDNAKLMRGYDVGLLVENVNKIEEIMARFAINRHLLAYMKANTTRLRKPFAAREVIQLINE